MKRLISLLVVALALAGLCLRADQPVVQGFQKETKQPAPKPADIVFPDLPVPPTPQPTPPAPNTPTRLAGDQVYVIRSETPLLVLTSLQGIVDMMAATGPITMYAKFVDSPAGKAEFRTFTEKNIYVLTAANTGTAELLVVPVGVADPKLVVRRLIEANVGPLPPPVPPVPPVPPIPPVPPVPVPSEGLRVLIVYDDYGNPPTAADALDVRQFYWAKCLKGPDGKTPEFRLWHKSVTPVGSDWYKEAFKRYPGKGPSCPSGKWLIAVNGGKSYEGEMPATKDVLLAELQRVGN